MFFDLKFRKNSELRSILILQNPRIFKFSSDGSEFFENG